MVCFCVVVDHVQLARSTYKFMSYALTDSKQMRNYICEISLCVAKRCFIMTFA
jgi:hypothetical protein